MSRQADRILAEMRSKQALEKQKIREDYESMAAQLQRIMSDKDVANKFLQVTSIFGSLYLGVR